MIRAVQEGLGGIRDVLIDGSQDYFENAFTSSYRSYRLAEASINSKAAVPRYLIEGFTMILIVGAALVMALRGQGLDQQLPLLGTLALGAYRLLQPLQQCFNSVAQLTASLASSSKVMPYLLPEVGVLKSVPARLHSRQPLSFLALRIDKVGFSYGRDSHRVLTGIDLTIRRGERIGLVGSTGSGKTTLVDLILGLLEPDEGEVFIDGFSLHRSPGLLGAWQASIAHVPQQIYLSDASFAENIAFGTPLSRIDWQRLEVAARHARLDQFIATQPQGYRTVVGERGVRLSGGQRQRIGIARALYKNAQLLILDEATSALDNVTEAEVMESIEALENHITVIMIAHRLSTVERCDHIILLENGMVSAEGSYSQLLSVSQSFRQLVESAGRS
jgi:ATP-binding cassette subfamily B protein